MSMWIMLFAVICYAAIWPKFGSSATPGPTLTIGSIPKSSGRTTKILNADDKNRLEDVIMNFMSKWKIPGLGVAFGKNEKLIYANGFGYADLEDRELVTVDHKFRIASCSKPITSVAILHLVETGSLSLEDLVFGPTGRLGNITNFQGHIRRLKVKHLLQHTSGGWQNDMTDPVFKNLQLDNEEFLKWVLRNYRLQNAPGSNYAYSNFGYFLLARIIEAVTHQTFEDYVKTTVFQPMGISDAFIGGSTLAERQPFEVVYYGESENDDPYNMNVQRMDGNGGWVMSPLDMLKFVVQVDGFSNKLDFLQASTIATMTQGSTANAGYAMGWQVNEARNWWHNGAMPGTTSELARIRSPRYSFAIAMNTRIYTDDTFLGEVDQLMWNILTGVEQWPAGSDI